MQIVEFENGSKIQNAYVEIDGVKHEVVPAVYTGKTPLSAYNINRAQKNLLTHKYKLTVSTTTSAGAEITLPCNYKVGQDVLDVYLEDERLIKSSNAAGSDGHYVEVGTINSISNKIKITSDWAVEAGFVFEFVVRGEYTNDSK